MQPFDALTMRAVLQEAKPLLLGRKIDKVYQLGRDEIILALRLKTGPGYFLLSAQASFGRLGLINAPPLPKAVNPPAFCQLLRKHISGGTIIGVEQLPGERVCDLTIACIDELGTPTTKVLTAEVMGRHSNLIFWQKDSEKIIGASHVVTAEMSRQREVAAGLRYLRPPSQDKPSIFQVGQADFEQRFAQMQARLAAPIAVADQDSGIPASLDQWLLTNFAGLGRHLADELIAGSGIENSGSFSSISVQAAERLWSTVQQMQTTTNYKPAMRLDLSRYTVLSWWPELQAGDAQHQWKRFPAVNDMVEDYFRTLQQREQMQQLKDRIRSELKSECDKLESRLQAACKQLQTTEDLQHFKNCGDLILANVANIQAGQTELLCQNLYLNQGNEDHDQTVTIELNPNISAAQNAQHYYRQFAKARVRKQAASSAQNDAAERMQILKGHLQALDQATEPAELNRLKEIVLDRGKRQDQQRPPQVTKNQRPGAAPAGGGKSSARLMTTKSSDGWLIYIGRNKNENDVLISKLAQPADIWLHVLGQEGAHVLIKNPNKQDPPASTLREAAQLAARFSRISLGSKVRVVYTHCRHVRKIAKDKPGLVRYENEKTLEVDTAAPMPASLRKLFTK